MKRPWWKAAITTVVILTAPIWLFPAMVVAALVMLWVTVDKGIWG